MDFHRLTAATLGAYLRVGKQVKDINKGHTVFSFFFFLDIKHNKVTQTLLLPLHLLPAASRGT